MCEPRGLFKLKKRKWIDALVLLRHFHMDPRRSSKNRKFGSRAHRKNFWLARAVRVYSGMEKYFSEGKIFTRTGQMTSPRVNGQINWPTSDVSLDAAVWHKLPIVNSVDARSLWFERLPQRTLQKCHESGGCMWHVADIDHCVTNTIIRDTWRFTWNNTIIKQRNEKKIFFLL